MVVLIVVVLSIIIGYNMMSNSEAFLSLLSISENNPKPLFGGMICFILLTSYFVN
jgi:type III secretory pathway component EscU